MSDHEQQEQEQERPPSLPIADPTLASREDFIADDRGHVENQISQIQTSAQEAPPTSVNNSNAVTSSSIEPSSASSFRRITTANNLSSNPTTTSTSMGENGGRKQHPSSTTNHLSPQSAASSSPAKPMKPLFGVDPIGRLLSFNSTNATSGSDNNNTSDYSSAVSDVDGDASPAATTTKNNHKNHNNNNDNDNQSISMIASTPAKSNDDENDNDASSIVIGSPGSEQRQQSSVSKSTKDENKPVVVSVANRRRMAAALRAPLNQQFSSSATPTPSNIEAYSILDDINNDIDDDDNDDMTTNYSTRSSYRSMSNANNNNTKSNNNQFSPSSIIGELPSYQSPIRGGDGGISLVTVLEEYNVLRNCKSWLQETQTRTFHSLDSQGDQLLDWQRRRLEQQSEGILDDLAGTLNPTTIAEMYDAIAGSLDQVENVLEPAFQDKLTELTSLRNYSTANNNNNVHQQGDHHRSGSTMSSSNDYNDNFGAGAKALSSYVNLLSLEADRILDLTSNIHVSLDSIKADLSEARSADTAFDLDRRQSRRTFAQKISILEEESRQLKFDLRREMKVCLDRDRKSKKKFDTVHGQLEALLKGVELFDDVREDISDTARMLEDTVSRSIQLRMNHNQEVTAAQESSPRLNEINDDDNQQHSPNSRERIQFYQRVAAISRKLKDHGFDLASMMSPSAAKNKEYKLNPDGSVKVPKVYQQTNTACFVDPSIIFATQDAKDLGAIEDIADEYFAPMSMEAYDQRRERSGSQQQQQFQDNNDDDAASYPRKAIHDRLNRINGKEDDPKQQSSKKNSNNNNSGFATPAVPAVLAAKPATVGYLEDEAKRQAAEILEEAKKRADSARDYLNEARRKAAVATGVPLSSYSPHQKEVYVSPFRQPNRSYSGDNHNQGRGDDGEAERPRLPSVAIPDSKVDPSRLTPRSPNESESLQSATRLHDLVPAPLRSFLPPEEEEHNKQQEIEEGHDDDFTAPSRSQESGVMNPGVKQKEEEEEEEPSRVKQQQKQQPYQNPKRPRKNSLINNNVDDVKTRPIGDLPHSISYRVGMPFGTTGTLGGEEMTTVPHNKKNNHYSRSSSADENPNDDENINMGRRSSSQVTAPPHDDDDHGMERSSPTGSLTLSEARRRRKEERLRQQQQQQPNSVSGGNTAALSPSVPRRRDPHYSPYDDTPPRDLRGLKTPTLYEDPSSIAFVSSKNHTGTPGTTDQFYYPHKNENPNSKNRNSSSSNKNSSHENTKNAAPLKKRRNDDIMLNDGSNTTMIPLEDYGETKQGGKQRYPDPEDNSSKYQPPAAFFVDLSSEHHHQDDVVNDNKKPSVLKNTNVKPNKSVPKPATFSKGLASNNKNTTSRPPSSVSPSSSRKSTPKTSHVLMPKKKETSTSTPTPAGKKKAHFAENESDDNNYYNYDGDQDAPIVADIDLTGGGLNNDNDNHNAYYGFSDPNSALSGSGRPTSTDNNTRRNIPTWIDLMNQKTQLESEYSNEYSDIARFRLEQERRNNNNNSHNNTSSGLDPRDYELLPNVGLDRALKQARQQQNDSHMNPTHLSSSKLAGVPFAAHQASSRNNNSNNSSRVHPSSVPSATQQNRPSSTTSSATARSSNIHTPVDNYSTQQDVRRHLDRLKLDTQEAVAKMRQSPVVQGLI